jgi:hypothetical protein
VTAVPPLVGPRDGCNELIVGDATYVNPPCTDVEPPTVVITTGTFPADPGGVAQVTDDAESAVTAQFAPPTATEAPVRFVPVMTMVVPPDVGPNDGATAAVVGGAT